MAGRQIYNPDGFKNMEKDGQTTGFQFEMKAQYYSNPHKQHTEKDFYRIFQTKKAEADRSLSPAASAFTYTFLSTFFQKSLYCTSHRNHRNIFKED